MKYQRGFTLVEILVASVIAAILATMAFTAMNHALQSRDRVRTAQARLVAVKFAMRLLVQDFSQAAARPVRMPVGEGYESAVLGESGSQSRVVLTRAGWNNPAALPRSTLQRVRYELREGVLYRDYWTVLDAQTQPQPVQRALLQEVTGFSLRYMNDARQWQESWPPAQPSDEAALRFQRWRPLAIEVTLQFADWGTITRVIEVAG